MPHVIEKAKTARSKCRGCKRTIEKDALRVGLAVPNAFGSGESLQYFHAICAAERRSEAALVAFSEHENQFEPTELAKLRALASLGVEHPRWTRVCGVELDPSGRAKCRHCREALPKGNVRIALEFVEEGMVNAAGYLHPECALPYLGTVEGILERLERLEPPADWLEQLHRGFAAPKV